MLACFGCLGLTRRRRWRRWYRALKHASRCAFSDFSLLVNIVFDQHQMRHPRAHLVAGARLKADCLAHAVEWGAGANFDVANLQGKRGPSRLLT